MLDQEIVAVQCQACKEMIPVQDFQGHACWEQELGMRTFEAAIEEVDEDCPHCPPDDVYPVKAGCFINGVPGCEWCAHTEEISQAYMAGEIQPLSPADIGKLV
jgi:hypothetical protein